MGLKKADSANPPPGTIRLTKDEAVDFQLNRLDNWKNPSELWFLNYGSSVLGGAAGISSAVILNFFRWRLRLHKTARFSSYLPTVVIPAGGAAAVQQFNIKNKILVQEICPVCVEIRAVCWQILFGIVQPTVLSMMLTFGHAHETFSYPIPDFNPINPTKFYKFTGNLFRVGSYRFGGMILLQLLATSLVIYKQYDELTILNRDTTEELSEFS